jgi:tetratricopeptide (TPR) repeat protein
MSAYDYFDLGSYSRPITTTSPLAQTWFDRGLIWTFSFNHLEAIDCFRRAVDEDSQCAMAWWGIAYCVGPYYNKPWDKFDDIELPPAVSEAYDACRTALSLDDGHSPVETALMEALLARYPHREPHAQSVMRTWTDDFANAMRAVADRFPNDDEVCTVYVDALMCRTPWALWNVRTGEAKEGADSLEALDALEGALDRRKRDGQQLHPGLLHLHIHLLEMSTTPERALGSANDLRHLVPGAGHLLHMPTHIDVQCGHYDDVVDSNIAAVAIDDKYSEYAGATPSHALSVAHNYHFMMYGAMFAGRAKDALAAAEGLVKALPEELLRIESPPMADWLEGYVALGIHARIRFGRWQEIIDLPLPDDQELFCTTTAMSHYAKSIAHAVLENVDGARQERELFQAARMRVPVTREVFNNTCQDIMGIAAKMLDGELHYRMGDHDLAFELLREAAQMSESLPYDEPWGWMQPPRHALGALMLEQGRVAEAEAVYKADLGFDDTVIRACQHPNNVWSLHGLHECLTRGGKTEEAAELFPALEKALASADQPIEASCLCRLERAY